MRPSLLPSLRCPVCVAAGADAGYHLDPIRAGGDGDDASDDVVEAFLVCRRCRAVRCVLGGIALLPRDVDAHLAAHGNVWRRVRIADPRTARFVLARATGGADVVPFAEVTQRYGDLQAAGGSAPRGLAAVDAALDDRLREVGARGPGLDVGCGVGRGVFVLAARLGEAVGVDRSAARLRRARNVATASEFHLPVEGAGGREVGVDLGRLVRRPVDFVAADPEALPFAAAAFGVVVLRSRDGEGPFADPAAARAQAERVTAPDGVLLVETGSGPSVRFEAVTPALRGSAR